METRNESKNSASNSEQSQHDGTNLPQATRVKDLPKDYEGSLFIKLDSGDYVSILFGKNGRSYYHHFDLNQAHALAEPPTYVNGEGWCYDKKALDEVFSLAEQAKSLGAHQWKTGRDINGDYSGGMLVKAHGHYWMAYFDDGYIIESGAMTTAHPDHLEKLHAYDLDEDFLWIPAQNVEPPKPDSFGDWKSAKEFPPNYTGSVLAKFHDVYYACMVDSGYVTVTYNLATEECGLRQVKACDMGDNFTWVPAPALISIISPDYPARSDSKIKDVVTGYAATDIAAKAQPIPTPTNASLERRLIAFAAQVIAKGNPEVLAAAEKYGLATVQNMDAPCCSTCQCVDDGKPEGAPCVTLAKPLQGVLS